MTGREEKKRRLKEGYEMHSDALFMDRFGIILAVEGLISKMELAIIISPCHELNFYEQHSDRDGLEFPSFPHSQVRAIKSHHFYD